MMMFIVLLLLACFQGVSAVQWTSTYQNTTTICPGRNLTLGWDFSLEPGETVEDIKWFFSSGSGQTPPIIAIYGYGQFDSFPPYGTRLTHLSNGKILLANVTSADAGTYTSQVFTSQTTGSFSIISRHLVVTVAGPSIYRDTTLSLIAEDQFVRDLHGKLHIRLTCGPLARRGQPAVDVIWTSPSGAQRNSTGYENDYFYLLVDNPVVGGAYACGLPASAIPALCLRAGDPLTGQAAVTVDGTVTRLALLLADNVNMTQQLNHMAQQVQQLERDNVTLTQQLRDVKRDSTNLTQQLRDVNLSLTQRLRQVEGNKVNLTQQLQDVQGDLTQQLQQVQTEQDQCQLAEVGNTTQRLKLLEDDFQQYRNISSTRAGFHAMLNSDVALNRGDRVKFSHIFYNEGGAYDNRTGQFTAPVNGTYFFVFMTLAYQSGHCSDSDLMAGSTAVASVRTKYSGYYNPGTGHAALALVKGTKVWVTSRGAGYQFGRNSLFSGFLL